MRVSRLKLSKKSRKKQSILNRLSPGVLFAPFLLFLSRFRFGLILGVFGSCAIVGAGLWKIGLFERFERQVTDLIVDGSLRLGYRFEDIFIQGRKATSSIDILNAVNMHRGDSSFKYSPHEIKARLEAIPWIERAEVQRYLPGILKIELKERQPIALWQHQQQYYYVDASGVVLQTKLTHVPPGLPLVVGLDAPQHAPHLLTLLANHKEVMNGITALVRINKRRWDLILANKLTIKLPETQVEVALARLNFLLEAKKINLDEVTMIDLRTPKRLIARVKPETATRLKLKANGDKKGEGV